jgi:diaminopimelate decarboxylase
MFSSNNTVPSLFNTALADGGCILNLDDISFIDKVSRFPELICFRYNPGEKRTGNRIIGIPVEAKYGVTDDQVVTAYRRARARGARRFGIHSMVISNERNYQFMVETVRMLMGVMERVTSELGIRFEFFNISGGVGISYHPEDTPFDMPAFAAEAAQLISDFSGRNGYTPKLFTEFGRYMTGPHGTLVTTVVNRMNKYRTYVGVDAATMCANPRPAIYGAYHHITILDPSGMPRRGNEEIVDVVGPLCENNDKFAIQRRLSRAEVGDILVQHDTGAHSPPWEAITTAGCAPGTAAAYRWFMELIRRAETVEDLFATLNYEPDVLSAQE